MESDISGGLAPKRDEIFSGPRDITDQAVEVLRGIREAGLSKMKTEELAKVRRAIENFRNGTYGICEECEKEISPTRLKAVPEASHCIECQKLIDTGAIESLEQMSA